LLIAIFIYLFIYLFIIIIIVVVVVVVVVFVVVIIQTYRYITSDDAVIYRNSMATISCLFSVDNNMFGC